MVLNIFPLFEMVFSEWYISNYIWCLIFWASHKYLVIIHYESSFWKKSHVYRVPYWHCWCPESRAPKSFHGDLAYDITRLKCWWGEITPITNISYSPPVICLCCWCFRVIEPHPPPPTPNTSQVCHNSQIPLHKQEKFTFSLRRLPGILQQRPHLDCCNITGDLLESVSIKHLDISNLLNVFGLWEVYIMVCYSIHWYHVYMMCCHSPRVINQFCQDTPDNSLWVMFQYTWYIVAFIWRTLPKETFVEYLSGH